MSIYGHFLEFQGHDMKFYGHPMNFSDQSIIKSVISHQTVKFGAHFIKFAHPIKFYGYFMSFDGHRMKFYLLPYKN